MSDTDRQTAVIIGTTITSLLTGFFLGVWSVQGYLIPPSMVEERRRNLNDPLESEESDIEESDTILDHAPNWANGAQADRKQGLSASAPSVRDNGEECKLVLVVRTDLGMTKGERATEARRTTPCISREVATDIFLCFIGKIAAQCSHATLACYKTISRGSTDSPERRILSRWEKYGQAKIAVQIKSQDELLELRRKARSMGLTAEVIQDAGRTQIEAGSMTVLGVGPAPKSVVDRITGHLKLL